MTLEKNTKHDLNIVMVGCGLVGSAFLNQLTKMNHSNIKLISITNSTKMIFNPKGIPLPESLKLFSESTEKSDINYILDQIKEFSNYTVIIDCTASSIIIKSYPNWLKMGFHIITPNKKAFSSDFNLFQQIKELSSLIDYKPNKPWVLNESSVGAGLPIIDTLKKMILTGDELISIEGVFSGTLSYIFNNFSSTNNKFSEIVKIAKNQGYTEPDPREDLNGLDVGRKIIICARLAGLEINLEDIQIENLIPLELRNINDVTEFMNKLKEFDNYYESLKQSNHILRYVGWINFPQKEIKVELKKYPLGNNPFNALQGSDNLIIIKSKYFPNGLIIQGSGAGSEVTSFGIHSDLLKLRDILFTNQI